MSKEYLINNIANYVKAVKENKTRFKGICFLIGSGADITSGGKTFRTLKLDFLKSNAYDVPSDIEDTKLTEVFDECVDKFSEAGRCTELEAIMRKHSTPSEGYELLVLLAELGYIDAIVTTNFDVLLEETQKELGVRPFDVFAPGVAVPNNFYEKRQKHTPIYLKLHGDLYGRYVSHLTKNEIENKAYGEEYIHMLEYILQNYTVISIGYGGYDELIADIFRNKIEDLESVWWCDIKLPDESAPLVKLLSENGKINYVNCSFDGLFCELASNLLRNKSLPDTTPHFLPSIIKAKVKEAQASYIKEVHSENEISRNQLISDLEPFFTNKKDSILFVHGKNGMGKTNLMVQLMNYYNELSFIPIHINDSYCKNILEHMANALGYKTDVPFALLYNFSKWAQKTINSFIFIIDEINILKYPKDSIKYLKEVLDFLTIIKEYFSIKIIICMETRSFNLLYSELRDSSYDKMLNNIEIGRFTLNEINHSINTSTLQNIDAEFLDFICEPYIYSLVIKDIAIVDNSLDKCIESYILANVDENNAQLLNKTNLSIFMEKIARVTLGEENNNILSKNIVIFLNKIGIVNESGCFSYERFTEYYYSKSLKRQRILLKQNFNESNPFLENKTKRHALARLLSDVDSTEELRISLDIIAEILNTNKSKYATLLAFETLQRIQKLKFQILEKYILCCKFEDNKISTLLDIICFSSLYASADPFNILNIIRQRGDNRFDAFIVKHEYLKKQFYQCRDKQNFKSYIDLLKTRSASQDAGENLCDLLYLLTEWGVDNVATTQYDFLIEHIRALIDNHSKKIVTDKAYYIVADKTRKYSYNILFNAGPDIVEKYSTTIHDTSLRDLTYKVIHGGTITEFEYLELVHKSIDINNAWTFLICNFITVCSMENNFTLTFDMLNMVPAKFENEDLVKQLDFYLSSVFMALYITENRVYQNFNFIFNKIVNLYERNLFELPDARMATVHRFTDEFEKIFEDGFNPLAFYFYVSPTECFLNNKQWDNGKEYLHLYWNLAEKLEKTGNHNKILRIVHALGQMISIYPKEGFEALENLTSYHFDVSAEGILRILKENYLRYPNETKIFLQNTKFTVSDKEMLEIEANRESMWSNRTFEQLHWTRLFVNLSKITGKNISNIFLSCFFSCESYQNFMVEMLKEIFE